jgi:hypothetical protein
MQSDSEEINENEGFIVGFEGLSLDEIAAKVTWPPSMDRVRLYHFNNNDEIWLEITKRKLEYMTITVGQDIFNYDGDGIIRIDSNGSRFMEVIIRASYDLKFKQGTSMLSLVDTRFRVKNEVVQDGFLVSLLIGAMVMFILFMMFMGGAFDKIYIK